MKRVVVPLLNIRAHFMDFINSDKLFSLQKARYSMVLDVVPGMLFPKPHPGTISVLSGLYCISGVGLH